MKFSLPRLDRLLRIADGKRFAIISIILVLAIAATGVTVAAATGKLEVWIAKLNGECIHEWADATCSTPKTCTLCGEKEGTTVNHELISANCTDAQRCAVCGQTWGEPLGHRWREATCTSAKFCERMGCDVVEGEALGHLMGEPTCTKPATCTRDGCRTTEGDSLGHTNVENNIAPTCMEAGKNYTACSICGEVFTEEEVPALGHNLDLNDDGVVDEKDFTAAKEPTCTQTGLKGHYKCKNENCGIFFDAKMNPIDSVILSMVSHTYPKENEFSKWEIVEPTCTDDGYMIAKCEVCSNVLPAVTIKSTGHYYRQILSRLLYNGVSYTLVKQESYGIAGVYAAVDSDGNKMEFVFSALDGNNEGTVTFTLPGETDAVVIAYKYESGAATSSDADFVITAGTLVEMTYAGVTYLLTENQPDIVDLDGTARYKGTDTDGNEVWVIVNNVTDAGGTVKTVCIISADGSINVTYNYDYLNGIFVLYDADGAELSSDVTSFTIGQQVGCYDLVTCRKCGFNNGGKVIGHDYTDPTCEKGSACTRCGHVDPERSEPLGHTYTEATCSDAPYCTRCGEKDPNGARTSHLLEYSVTSTPKANIPTYTCKLCQTSFKTSSGFYISDGSDYANITPINNYFGGYTTAEENNHYPLIVETEDGNRYYSLLRDKEVTTQTKTDGTENVYPPQLQLWVPMNRGGFQGFDSKNSAVGFISFSINAYMDVNFGMKFVEGASGWDSSAVLVDDFLAITPITDKELKDEETGDVIEWKQITVKGWDDLPLLEKEVAEDASLEDKFTGWIDVYIGVVLDPEDDTITLHYYLDGEYKGSRTKELTTGSNGIKCVYISGNTEQMGSGMMIDDIAFGYNVAGHWSFDGVHEHNWVVDPKRTVEASCLEDGYQIEKCTVCGSLRRGEVILATGHINIVDINAESPTCTETGLTLGKMCNDCGMTIIPQEVLDPLGHTPEIDEETGEAKIYDFQNVNCDLDAWNEYYCTVCESKYKVTLELATGHNFGELTCGAENAQCKNTYYDNDGNLVNCSYTETLEHIWVDSTCTEYRYCSRAHCGKIDEDTPLKNHILAHNYAGGKLSYYCETCDGAYTVTTGSFADGSNHNNMAGIENSKNGFTVVNGEFPAIVDGHYELLNTTGVSSKLQLWIPTNDSAASMGLTAENGAIGFLSFKLNAYITGGYIDIHFVDGASNSNKDDRWKPAGVAGKISIQPADGGYKLVDYDFKKDNKGNYIHVENVTVVNLPAGSDNFTGWVDIKIAMELNADTDQITYHYYIDGKYITSFSKELTTKTNSINSIYISGSTTAKGSGIKLDDIGFGCITDGEWIFDKCAHTFGTKGTVEKEVSCYEDEYSRFTCTKCGYAELRITTAKKEAHSGNTIPATCKEPAKCEDCGFSNGTQDALGHTGGDTTVTCTEKGTCTRLNNGKVCGEEYVDALDHIGGTATCYELAKCTRVIGKTEDGEDILCGEKYGELLPHNIVTEATCTTNAVCNNEGCGEVADTALGHVGTATCISKAVCSVCGNEYGDIDSDGHTPSKPTCTGKSLCSLCGKYEFAATNHNILSKYEGSKLFYYCEYCDTSYEMVKNYYFNCDSNAAETNNFKYIDEKATYNATYSNGKYEFVHNGANSEVPAKAYVWIPGDANGKSIFDGFTADNNAFGFLSFTFNSYTTNGFTVELTDLSLRNNSKGIDFWSKACLSVFNVSAPNNGEVTLTGMKGSLGTLTTQSNGWTGDVKVVIGIELQHIEAFNIDQLIIHYYINDKYMASQSKIIDDEDQKKTIINARIDGVVFLGTSQKKDSGYTLDDVGFGYVYGNDVEWAFESCKHQAVDGSAIYNKATCLEDKYVCYTCSKCGLIYTELVRAATEEHDKIVAATCEVGEYCETCGEILGDPFGHIGGTATCHSKAICTREIGKDEQGNPILCGAEHGELLPHNIITEASCTTNAVCGNEGCGEVADTALGHVGGVSTCLNKAVCDKCKEEYGELTEHFGGTATCTKLKECQLCGTEYGDFADHIVPEGQYTCAGDVICALDGCNATIPATSHNIVTEYADSKLTYYCEHGCGASMTMEELYYANGENNVVIKGADNSAYSSVDPAIKEDENGNKYYEILKKENGDAQLQMWLPDSRGAGKGLQNFNSANNSVGFVSMKINAFCDPVEKGSVGMKFVESSSGWQDGPAIDENFFDIKYEANKVKLVGWGITIFEKNVADATEVSDKFTGWVDVKIGIVLDSATDKVILYYYANGEYKGTASRTLVTYENGIKYIYVSGYSNSKGSGVMLDDVAFGCVSNEAWSFTEVTASN